jgi:hypothetical protein
MAAEAVSGAVQSAQQTGGSQLSQLQGVKLDVVLRKAARARQILQQVCWTAWRVAAS